MEKIETRRPVKDPILVKARQETRQVVTIESVLEQLTHMDKENGRRQCYFPISNIARGLLLRKGYDGSNHVRYGELIVRSALRHLVDDLNKVEEARIMVEGRKHGKMNFDSCGYAEQEILIGYRIKQST